MNDDDPREVLGLLKAEHRRLDEEIELLRTTGNCDQLELARMKKRKLALKDEIQVSSPTASSQTSSPELPCPSAGHGRSAGCRIAESGVSSASD